MVLPIDQRRAFQQHGQNNYPQDMDQNPGADTVLQEAVLHNNESQLLPVVFLDFFVHELQWRFSRELTGKTHRN